MTEATAETAASRLRAGRRDERRRLALAVLCTAEVLVMLDGMVVSVALPSIQRDLGFSAPALQWVITAYTLALGSFLLLGGRVADVLGARRTLLLGLTLFTAASLFAGLARSPALLLGARAAAGLGAALAIPSALALIAAIFREGRDRTRALGYMSASIDVGMVVGAVLGGVITSALGWPWVFFLVVPLGVAMVALTPQVIEESGEEHRPQRLDALGALTAAGGLGMLIFAATRAEAAGVTAPATLASLAASLALLAAFAAVERRAPAPLLRAELLRRRPALAANLAIVANAGAFGGVVVLSTLYMQRVLGFSALEAGLGFVPLAVSAGVGGPLAARLVAGFGVRRVVTVSLLVTAGAVLLLAGISADGGYLTALAPAFAVAGLTFATAAVPHTAEAVAGAAPADQGVAAGLFQTCTHAGGAVVLAVLVIGAAARTDAAPADGYGQAAALVDGYQLAFLLTAALLVLGAAVTATLLRPIRSPPRAPSRASA